MSLQLDCDDLPDLRKGRQKRPEHVDCAQAAVKQNQRSAGAVDLVIHLEAIRGSVSGLRVSVCHLDSFLFYFFADYSTNVRLIEQPI
jgi:hypothetical protein